MHHQHRPAGYDHQHLAIDRQLLYDHQRPMLDHQRPILDHQRRMLDHQHRVCKNHQHHTNQMVIIIEAQNEMENTPKDTIDEQQQNALIHRLQHLQPIHHHQHQHEGIDRKHVLNRVLVRVRLHHHPRHHRLHRQW